jgi:hypothetical protein
MINNLFIFLIAKEFKLLSGKRYSNILFSFLIFFITFIAIGFSSAMRKNLQDKMDSPFVRFVRIELPTHMADEINSGRIFDSLDCVVNRKRFSYSRPFPEYNQFINVLKANSRDISVSAYAKSVSDSDDFFDFLCKDESLFDFKTSYLDSMPYNFDVVITSDFYYKELGYSHSQKPNFINLAFGSNDEHILPIRVAGIAKRLPHNVKVLMSEKLFYCYKKKSEIDDNPLETDKPYYKTNFSLVNLNNTIDLKLFLKCKYTPIVKKFDDYTQIDFRIPDSDTEFRDSIFKNFSPDSVFLIYPYSSRFADNIDRLSMGFVEAYTIPFFSLDSIERFQEYAYREPLSLNVDMNTVESKKNFQIFSNVAQALAFFLSVIAIVLISSYNFSLLVSHINRNKKNLGTLKAFGLGNHVIIGIYSTVSFLLVSLGFCLCFAFLGFCGNALVSLFMKFGLFPFNKGEIFYDMWSFFDAFFVFVFLPVGVLFMKLYLFIHKATPGDLIFGR